MNKENIQVITDREKLYDKCENMKQLFDKYYLPLLDKHYSKTYELQQENQKLKKQLEEVENENFNFRENIYIEKMSFSSEGRNIKELIEMPTYEDLLNQQKEFIEYLENEIKHLEHSRYVSFNEFGERKLCFYKEILSKYQEIIGGKDE